MGIVLPRSREHGRLCLLISPVYFTESAFTPDAGTAVVEGFLLCDTVDTEEYKLNAWQHSAMWTKLECVWPVGHGLPELT